MDNIVAQYPNSKVYELYNPFLQWDWEGRDFVLWSQQRKLIIYLWWHLASSSDSIYNWQDFAQDTNSALWCVMTPWSYIPECGIENIHNRKEFSLEQSTSDLLDVLRVATDYSDIHFVANSLWWVQLNYLFVELLNRLKEDAIQKQLFRIKSVQYISSPFHISHLKAIPSFLQLPSTIASLFALLLKKWVPGRSLDFTRELLQDTNPLDDLSWKDVSWESVVYLFAELHKRAPHLMIWYMGWRKDRTVDMEEVSDILTILESIFWDKFQQCIFSDAGHGLEEEHAPRDAKIEFQQWIITG